VNAPSLPPFDVRLMNAAAGLLLLVFVLLGAAAAARWVARLAVFDIQGITVYGDVLHTNAVTLRANVGARINGTFFTVDLARVRAAFQAVPWVRHAVVRRDFPNRLRVTLQEHQAVAFWDSGIDARLVYSYGEVFEANIGEVEQDPLPRLSGPDGQAAEVLGMYRTQAPRFEAKGLPVRALTLSGRGSWHVELDTGARVELGRGNEAQVAERVDRFLKTLTQVTTRYGRTFQMLESADLRHENGYALRLRGVTTAEPGSSTKSSKPQGR